MLDVPTTERFINDCVSFHFDIVQCGALVNSSRMMSIKAFPGSI